MADYVDVTTGKLDANAQVPDGKYPFFTCGEEILRINSYAFDSEAVLLAGNGNFNLKYYSGKFNAYQRTYVIRPIHIGLKFVFYQLIHLLPQITKGNRGSTVRFIRVGDILNCDVQLPPSTEQHRIVEELEKQLTRLDAATAALKRVQANLKRYRASVLKAACEGRLVPTEAELARKEGRTYEAGQDLLARILKERRAKWEADQLAKMIAAGKPPKDNSWKAKYKEPKAAKGRDLPVLPHGWIWATWEQLSERVTVGHVGPMKNEYIPNGVPFLRSQNVRPNRFDSEGLLYISETFHTKLAKSIVSVEKSSFTTRFFVPARLMFIHFFRFFSPGSCRCSLRS